MKRILVIEDEELVREVIVEFLEAEGFQAICTENGREGVQLAKESQPDLIICDILMPEMDGYQVLRELQQESSTAGIPFIFLTAKAGREALQQGLGLGASEYLEKPIRLADLLGAITLQLNRFPDSH